jgi:hypothetical protein
LLPQILRPATTPFSGIDYAASIVNRMLLNLGQESNFQSGFLHFGNQENKTDFTEL